MLLYQCHFLFITARTLKKQEWENHLYSPQNYCPAEHIEYYFQKPDNKNTPRLFIRSKGDSFAPAVKDYDLPIQDIIEFYDKGYFKTEYRKKDPVLYRKALNAIIDYFKLGFTKHESYSVFTFNWKPTNEYRDISEFYADTIASCYKVSKQQINFNGLSEMVDEGMGFLFEIYSKDFSDFSHGAPNLHTLYFKALFEECGKGRVRLQGGGEVFFRKKSRVVP